MINSDYFNLYNCNMEIVYMQDAASEYMIKNMKIFTFVALKRANFGGYLAIYGRKFG